MTCFRHPVKLRAEGISPCSRSLQREVVLYRDLLLVETFIREQALNLSRYHARFLGLMSSPEVPLDGLEAYVLAGSRNLRNKPRQLPFRLTGRSFKAARVLKGAALVHAHFGPDAAQILPLAERMRVPLIATFHGYDATSSDAALMRSGFSGRQFLRRRQALFRYCSIFLAVSDYVRNCLLERGFPPEKVVTHYVGVDTSRFSPPVVGSRKSRILFVGRLVANKGADHLLRGLDGLRSVPDLSAAVVGDGPLRGSLEAEARRLRLPVEFLGRLTPEQVRVEMSRSRVLCVPSVAIETGESEGFGLVAIEAQAMGLPVIAYRTGGLPEAVKHGVSGFLAEPNNVASLSHYLGLALGDSVLWQRLHHAAREHVVKQFDLTQQTRILEGLYDQVVDGYRGAHQVA